MQRAVRLAGVLALFALLTLLGFWASLNAITVSFAYLFTILLVSTLGTLGEAVIASLVATACLSYFFFEPIFSFAISGFEDWAALIGFLSTALTVNQLSSVAKSQTRAALVRSREMEKLYLLSRAVLQTPALADIPDETIRKIRETFEFDSVIFRDSTSGVSYSAGPPTSVASSVTPVFLGTQQIGELSFRGDALTSSALQSLANLVAISLDRARMLETTMAANLVRKSDELKSTLLDAIAHEFKTPLTSIKAAASALRSGMTELPERAEFVAILDEEADRMESLVTDAIRMARIESGKLSLNKRETPVPQLVASSIAPLTSLFDGRVIQQDIDPHLAATADPELVQLVLRQVVDNALKYSPQGSPIAIHAKRRDNDVLITIANLGPGIPEAEQSRIFERYYRSADTRMQVPGTGIGLSIAREIMLAHGGQIWAESRPGEGSRFYLLLPAEEMEKVA